MTTRLMDIEILNEKKRNREEKPEALASPENVTKKKKKKKRKVKENEAETEQQNQQPSQVCPKPLVVVTTPISLEETPKKKKIKKKKSNLIGEQQELNKNKEEENGEVPNETNALAIEVPTNVELKTEEQIQYPEPLVVPISVEANLVDPKDIPKKNRRGQKKKKHKNKSDLNGEQQELNKEEVPNETNPPKPSLAFEVSTDLEKKTETLDRNKSQTEPHTPIPVSLIPQTSTLQPAIPIETEQKLSKSEKKRKRKRKNKNVCPKQCSPIEQTVAVDPAISMDEPAPQIGQTIPMNKHQRKRMNKKKNNKILDGAQPNGHNIKQPETLVQNQTSICHTTTPPIYQTTDPHTAIPICPKPAALIDQTSSVVDSALSIGPEPAPLIGQTFPVDPAIPIDTQQKLSMDNRKQRRMAKKSLLSEEQPNGHDPKSTAKAPVRETIGVTVTKDPRSQICWACRKSDHKISQCRMLKSLSKHAEVCFFCGEIGHSLGRCSVSSAGGGRLAKCLLCHADGHFSYNCPGDGHGNYLEPAAAGRGVHC